MPQAKSRYQIRSEKSYQRYLEFKKLREQGLTYKEIGKMYGIHFSVVYQTIARWENPDFRKKQNERATRMYHRRYGIDEKYTEQVSLRHKEYKEKKALDRIDKGLNQNKLSSMDISCKEDTAVEIELQDRPIGKVLYVNVNGQTVLRISQIQKEIKVVGFKDSVNGD